MTLTPCGMPVDVAEGNRLSDAIFSAHVRRADLVEKPPDEAPQGFSPVSLFGAVGDGKTDDSAALQEGLNVARQVWLEPTKVYRITKRLVLRDGCAILSDGTATVEMASGDSGFANSSWAEDQTGIFSEKGTGIQVCGRDVQLQHFFLAKEYEDDRYVIGVEVVSPAENVVINRIRLRGFSLAPGIISIKSAKNVEVTSSLIHAAYTQSTHGMWLDEEKTQKNARYQITAIVIDDQAPAGDSQKVSIENNVITDIWMKPVGRGDQSDGINIHQNRSASQNNIALRYNYINHVAEGVDSFGHNVLIEENTIGGREQAIKLIHGATTNTVRRNWIVGKMSICGVGVWSGSEKSGQVKDILIAENLIDMRCIRTPTIPGVKIDLEGTFPPSQIHIIANRFLMDRCDAISITSPGAIEENNEELHEGVLPCAYEE